MVTSGVTTVQRCVVSRDPTRDVALTALRGPVLLVFASPDPKAPLDSTLGGLPSTRSALSFTWKPDNPSNFTHGSTLASGSTPTLWSFLSLRIEPLIPRCPLVFHRQRATEPQSPPQDEGFPTGSTSGVLPGPDEKPSLRLIPKYEQSSRYYDLQLQGIRRSI